MATSSEFRILVGGTATQYNTYTGLEFGNSGERILITSVSGLEIPPIRNNNGDWSGRDGGYMSSQLYSARVITITGFYWDADANCGMYKDYRDYINKDSIRERLANAFSIRKLYPIFVSFVNGKSYYTEGYMTDFRMDYSNYRTGSYQITFYCPDYAFAIADKYGDSSSVWRTANLQKEELGGHPVPKDLPVWFQSGTQATTVNYAGLIPGYPTITIKGPVVNPTIYNKTTEQIFTIGSRATPLSLREGQTLVIDMQNRQVTVNDRSRSMYITEESTWINLVPGKNKLYYTSGAESDTKVANITWRDLVQGI